MLGQQPDDTSVRNPFNASPFRTHQTENPPDSPNRQQNESPQRNERESINVSPLPRRNQLPESENELDFLLYNTDQLVEVKRSDYIPPIELVAQQDKYLRTIEVEGVLGTKPVRIDKAQLLADRLENPTNANAQSQVQSSTNYLKKDGLFVANEEENISFINMQRLEQRLFWENRKEWFRKDNGELIQDSQIFNERITKMRDVSIARNPNLSIIKKNAYLSERENQKKTQYFKLDILVGKIYLTKHPLFINEDEQAVALKSLVKQYKEKADLTLIPHLRKQLEQLNVEHQKLVTKYDVPPKEIEVIEREIKLVQTMLKNETSSLQDIMEKIYKTWEEIKKIRTNNNFSSTTVRLNVRQYKSEEYTNEFELFLSPQEYSKASDFSGRQLPYHERTRRQRIAQFKVWVGIYINGVYVGKTKKVFLEWPSFEVNFLEKFQIYLFRKPATIEFKIYMGTIRSILVDTVSIDIPGENANTLTSSSTIYREKVFAKRIHVPQPKPQPPAQQNTANNPQGDQTPNKNNTNNANASPQKDQKNIDENQKSPINANNTNNANNANNAESPQKGLTLGSPPRNKEAEAEQEITNSPISGVVYYKAEWFGYGTSLPPPTIDKLGGKRQEGIKVKNYYEQSLENLVDLNDPRNELAIQQLKQLKNQQIQEVLKRDAMMPFSEVESLRHRLYKLKFQKIDLARQRIPLTEEEILNNFDFMRFINEYEREMQELENEGEYQVAPLLKENLTDVDKFPYSLETRKRLVKYRKRLYVRQQEIQTQRARDVGNIMSLKSVVNEFYFEEGIDPIAEFFKSVFAQRGKLRPVRKTQLKVKAERIERADILVHVVKGKDVPARAKAAGQIKVFREQALAAGYQSGFSPRAFSPRAFPPNQGPGSYPNQNEPGGYSNYPNYPNNYPNYPNSPSNPNFPNFPNNPNYPNYGNTSGYMGQGQGPEGYPYPPGMRSPMRDQSAHDIMPGYHPGYSPRHGQDPYGNDMNAQYRSGQLHETQAMRHVMGSQFDTRMAVQGALPTDNLLVERVLPFLEVKLHDPEKGTLYTVKTETYEGTYPEWNDNLVLPLKINREDLEYDITTNPQNNQVVVYFSLFDLVSSVSKHRESTNKYSVVIEKRYLGSFSIPLVTLFRYPQQNAVFKVERPLFLFGYYNMKPVFSADPQMSNMVADPFTPTYVTLSLTIDPPLDLPVRSVVDYYSGAENPQLLLNGTNWLKNLKKNNKIAGRNIKLWGNGINKMAQLESRFLPRYLTPLIPPIDVIDESAYTKAARFVSLIPTRSDTLYFKDLPELWSTCQEFLDIQAGGQEEHAILLCNYFTYIDQQLKKENMKNYLLLGKAVPEGETVYVLRRNTVTNDIELWDACHGDPYFFKRRMHAFNCFYLFALNRTSMLDREVSDNEYPIQEIGCVISNENVWVNIQQDVTPSHVIFDIENKKNWLPFLGEKSHTRYFPSKTIDTIQTELKYDKTPTEFVQRLEKKIQSEIAKRIETERSSLENGKRAYRTKWERRFGDRLRNILLTSFESFKYRTRTTGTRSSMTDVLNVNKSKDEIEQIKDDILNEVPEGGDIYGFPLNMPYTNMEKIWQEVKNTDIHNIQNDDVEYVLAVGVYAYDHFVLSVWIFVGVIFNKPIKAR